MSSLDDETTGEVSDRCQECGAKLTSPEIRAVFESGGPPLCSVHADEVVALGEDDGFE